MQTGFGSYMDRNRIISTLQEVIPWDTGFVHRQLGMENCAMQ